MERSILDFAAVLELPLEITHQHTCFFFQHTSASALDFFHYGCYNFELALFRRQVGGEY